MNISPEKQKHYEQLYETMYQASLRTGKTPVPTELKDPAEQRKFLLWRHEFWVNFSHKAAKEYRAWLNSQTPPLALAETASPSPSKS